MKRESNEKVTLDTKMGEFRNNPELGEVADYIFYSNSDFIADYHLENVKLSELDTIGWNPEMVARGINLLIDQAVHRGIKPHYVYSESECTDDPQKKKVNLIYMKPEKVDPTKPYVVLISGGAYVNVSNGAEAFPTASHMLKRGYQVFVLTYRVGGTEALPRALDDVAASLRYIRAHANEFEVKPDHYVMAGYSAGGILITSWGTTSVGYKVYGLPSPKALFPIYPLVDFRSLVKQSDSKDLKEMMGDGWDGLTAMLGENYSQDDLIKYNTEEHIGPEYPPCYIVCGKDDLLIPSENSSTLKQRLDEKGVSAVLEMGEHAPHGFGDGTGTDVEGWPERALDFIEMIL